MKKLAFITFILIVYFLPYTSYSQDRIITKRNQRIECKILPIRDKEYVYFQIFEDNELKYTLIPKNDVKRIDRNFYKSPILNMEQSLNKLNYHKLLIAAKAGLGRMSYQIDQNLAPQLKDFQNRERFGLNLELEIQYMFSESFGIFVNYMNFTNNLSKTYQFSNPGNPSEPLELTFNSSQLNQNISLGVEYFTLLSEKASFSVGIGLGRFNNRYDIDYDFLTTPTRYLGNNISILTKINFNYRVSENLYVQAGINFLSANMTKVREITENSDTEVDLRLNPWSVSRTNFTLGLRYGFDF